MELHYKKCCKEKIEIVYQNTSMFIENRIDPHFKIIQMFKYLCHKLNILHFSLSFSLNMEYLTTFMCLFFAY